MPPGKRHEWYSTPVSRREISEFRCPVKRRLPQPADSSRTYWQKMALPTPLAVAKDTAAATLAAAAALATGAQSEVKAAQALQPAFMQIQAQMADVAAAATAAAAAERAALSQQLCQPLHLRKHLKLLA